MCSDDPSCRLTRVVSSEGAVQLTCKQDVMQRIQASLQSIPDVHKDRVANALLEFALAQLLQESPAQIPSSPLKN